MKTVRALIAAAVLPLSACTHVGSAAGPGTTATGDTWYAKQLWVGLPFPVGTSIWYCPAQEGGPATCAEARIVKGPVAAPAQLPVAEPADTGKKKKKKKAVEDEDEKSDEEATEPSD